jgi:diguanylate cyclase (GGDEF)-like protein/PAS domain S-box-containing protein
MPRVVFRNVLYSLLTAVLLCNLTCQAQQVRCLSTVAQVQRLSHDSANKGVSVCIRGQVTYFDPEWRLLFVRDATGSMFVESRAKAPALNIGDVVDVFGSTVGGAGGAFVAEFKLQVQGNKPLVDPRVVDIRSLSTVDSTYISTKGVIRAVRDNWDHSTLLLRDGPAVVQITLPHKVTPYLSNLVGAKVLVRGVSSLLLDENNRPLGYQMFVQQATDIKPEDSDWKGVGDSHTTLAAAVVPPGPATRFVPAIHLRGRTLWHSATALVLQDSSGTMEVLPFGEVKADPGTLIDVIGFPAERNGAILVADATVSIRQPALQYTAAVKDQRIVDDLRHLSDGDRLRITGKLVSQSTDGKDLVFELLDQGRPVRVLLPAPAKADGFLTIAPGSIMTAVGTVRFVHKGKGKSLDLLVDSPSQLTIRNGLHINWRRAVPATVGALVLIVLLWVVQMRRSLEKKTSIIRQQLQHEIALEERYKRLFERNLAAVFSWEPGGVITDCNAAFAQMLGYDMSAQVIGLSYWELQGKDSRTVMSEYLHDHQAARMETSLRRVDGAVVHLLESITVVRSEYDISYETTALDITQSHLYKLELKEARDAARREAEEDSLTELPNRRSFTKSLVTAVNKSLLTGQPVALLYIDLDGFKTVNDTMGHSAGDQLLREISERISANLPREERLFRIGGDEFAVLLTRTDSAEDSAGVANRIIQCIENSLSICDRSVFVSASIGISTFPVTATNDISLFQQADTAMYFAKHGGRERVKHYTPEIGAALQEKSRIASELRGAVARHELSLHYQPEFSASDQQLVRFEALIRWNSQVLGSVPSGIFIPIAEDTGMIFELGTWALETACRDAVSWQKDTGLAIPVAINVSGIQMGSELFVDQVMTVLQQTGLAPELLELEMTESVMLNDVQRCREMLIAFRSAGITLALDDFGTGYSSFSYLQDLPFDRLKIERSFVARSHAGANGGVLMRAVISLAHSLGLSVVVEGIETQEEMAFVRSLGADDLQGFLLGRPSPEPCSQIRATSTHQAKFHALVADLH